MSVFIPVLPDDDSVPIPEYHPEPAGETQPLAVLQHVGLYGKMAYRKRSDQAHAARAHYHRNKRLYKTRAKAHTAKVREAIKAYVAGYLSGHPCLDCGESDPIVLEFDHRDRAQKSFNIGDAIRRGYALKRVIAEIAKCDVRCANCHRRKTFREREAYSSAGASDLAELPLFDR